MGIFGVGISQPGMPIISESYSVGGSSNVTSWLLLSVLLQIVIHFFWLFILSLLLLLEGWHKWMSGL